MTKKGHHMSGALFFARTHAVWRYTTILYIRCWYIIYIHL
jgi:hypothetical protein